MAVTFSVSLAGIVIGISAQNEIIRDKCGEYRTEEPPQVTVSISEKEILDEASRSGNEGIDPVNAEWLALHRKIAASLLQYDTLLFHGSAIAVDGAAYLFTAPSGTGKSTHTALWRQMLGDRAVMINDDKPLLRFTEDQIYVCGSPWDGKHHLSRNIRVPLQAVAVLSRAAENSIVPLSSKAALPCLSQQSFRPNDPAALARSFELSCRLSKIFAVYDLKCNMQPEAARIAYEKMSEKKI